MPLLQRDEAELDESSRALEMLTYDAGASAESIEALATAVDWLSGSGVRGNLRRVLFPHCIS